MLTPSIWIELTGTLIISVLLIADWYIWGARYRSSEGYGPEFHHHVVTDGEHPFSLQRTAESEFANRFGSECVGEHPSG